MTTVVRPAGSLEEQLAQVVADVLRLSAECVTADVTFAELGMDSLAAVELTAAIEDALQIELPMSAVHEHPTLRALCAYMYGNIDPDAMVASRARMRADAMLPTDVVLDGEAGAAPLTRDARRVLVTGATGFVGAFLVRALADQSPAVIWFLVRPTVLDPRCRLIAKLE
jgi:acyl carrier protein